MAAEPIIRAGGSGENLTTTQGEENMTAYTDRMAALKAASQDLARDLEADLGKAARHRGAQEPTTRRVANFPNPGADIESYQRQISQYAHTPADVLEGYGGAARQGAGYAHAQDLTANELTARDEVLTLLDSIANVTNHDEAVALVATFTE